MLALIPSFPPAFTGGWAWCLRCAMSLWSVGVGCPGCVPSQLFECPQPPRWQGSSRHKKSLTAYIAQQQLKHPCVTNAVLVTNPKHSATEILWRKRTYPSQTQYNNCKTCSLNSTWHLYTTNSKWVVQGEPSTGPMVAPPGLVHTA